MAVIEYWLQIENRPWDAMPNGIDRMTGAQMMRGANGLFKPLPADALIIRRYTANWQSADDRLINPWDLNEPDPAQTRGTIPGATLEAKVGDAIIVHFRNMDMRTGVSDAAHTHSLHVHGLQRAATYDGTYPVSPPDPNQNGKQGDRVAPGDSFDYHYTVPHASNAGTWLYHDHSMAHHESILLGAFGTIVIRGGGEPKAELPTGPLRTATDTPTQFAAVLKPAAAVEHIVFFHELAGVGECMNGRQMLGNTPTFVARANSRVKFRCINLTDRAQTFHIHGHRWAKGTDWADTEVLGSSGALTIEMLEGSAENGGGAGEWLVMSHTSHVMSGSLVVTEGGMLMLPVGMMAAMPDMPDMPEMGGGEHHH